jgi:DNA-binding NtrC family response regulator
VKSTRIETLKRVSGRLRRMLSGQNQIEESLLPRLLIVDDEESICFSMSEYFELHGYKVDTARDMEEAEKLIENTSYKVIIQDLRLGINRSADGLEIIKLVSRRQPDTRIIVLTAYGSAEMEDEARQCGADAFLRKPKPLSQVAQVVQGLLESPPKHAVRSA